MNYDVIVIGSGPGGYVTAIRASQLGLKTAIVEKENLGGVCLNWGCIPTKALIKSAQVFEYINHANDYGINVNGASADFSAVIKRSRDVADGMSKGIQFLMKKNKIDVIDGTGVIKKGGMVEVTAADGKKVMGYRQAMTLAKQPKSMVIVGSGAIGCEFAYVYNAMGTKVTIVEFLDNIVPLEDEDVSKNLARSFKKSGINIMTGSAVESVDSSADLCKVSIKTAKGIEIIEAEVVLSAVGITANIENIGLEECGVKTDKGKVLVDEFYRTNIPGIYAIGDIVPGQALAHVASAEGIICVEKIAGKKVEALNYNNIPGCTYCNPEVASVGMTEKAAKAAGYEVKVGKFPFSASGKASASGSKDGFVKLVFDAKYGELLGCHMIGSNVTEMIAEAVVARKLEITGHELIKTVHPHPTMSEAIMEAAADAYGEVIHM